MESNAMLYTTPMVVTIGDLITNCMTYTYSLPLNQLCVNVLCYCYLIGPLLYVLHSGAERYIPYAIFTYTILAVYLYVLLVNSYYISLCARSYMYIYVRI